jgi:peptidyl-prolyl cis-trans isomerase SurA
LSVTSVGSTLPSMCRWTLISRNAARVCCGVVAALATTLLVTACRSTPPPSPPPVSADTWAVVDGKEITRDDVEKTFRRVRDSGQVLSDEETLTAKLGVLDDLIVEEILLAKARQQNLQVSESEIDMAYADAKKNISDEAFQQQLTQRNLTAADMREGLRRQLLTRKLLDGEVGSKVVIPDQQVTDFFNANRAQFNLPEDAFHLAQIVVTPVRDPQLANRTGDDATTPETANAKIAMLMERLQQGTAFADLARDYSEDPESAPRGGDLGLVPVSAVKQAPPPLRDAVLQMAPGKARVVNQGGARTIVFVVAQERAGQRDLSTPGVRQQITDTLRGRREQVLRTAYLTAARTDARVVNYLARRVVESRGTSTNPQP